MGSGQCGGWLAAAPTARRIEAISPGCMLGPRNSGPDEDSLSLGPQPFLLWGIWVSWGGEGGASPFLLSLWTEDSNDFVPTSWGEGRDGSSTKIVATLPTLSPLQGSEVVPAANGRCVTWAKSEWRRDEEESHTRDGVRDAPPASVASW